MISKTLAGAREFCFKVPRTSYYNGWLCMGSVFSPQVVFIGKEKSPYLDEVSDCILIARAGLFSI